MTTINKLIETHIYLADQIASTKQKRLPRSVHLEELKSAAYFGLVDAAHKYESHRCDNFGAYASFRIKGAIQDYLRELGWGTRKNPRGHSSLEYEPAAPSEDSSGELFFLVMSGFTRQRRDLIRSYFIEDKTQEEIGAEVGLSKARVCQILSESCRQIRSEWSEERLLEEVA